MDGHNLNLDIMTIVSLCIDRQERERSHYPQSEKFYRMYDILGERNTYNSYRLEMYACERERVQGSVCMCLYIWKASAYEIEDGGTSGNTSGDILREKGFFCRYSKMYIKACKIEILN